MAVLQISLVVLLFVFLVVTYVSWATPIGTEKRYYYYSHALVALGVLLALFGYLINDIQRRRDAERERVQRTLQINQQYWVDLERYLSEHALELNRLYKQIWSGAPDVQSIPDTPVTPASRILEVHAANMLFGMISNMNAAVAGDTPDNQVLQTWQQPEYRTWYRWIVLLLQSNIMQQRWIASRDMYTPQMRTLVDSILQQRDIT